jgi:hypothetical protein
MPLGKGARANIKKIAKAATTGATTVVVGV